MLSPASVPKESVPSKTILIFSKVASSNSMVTLDI